MRTITKLTVKELARIKKDLHKIEYENGLEVLNQLTKILDNSSELREVIISLERKIGSLEKEKSKLTNKINFLNEVIEARNYVINCLRQEKRRRKKK